MTSAIFDIHRLDQAPAASMAERRADVQADGGFALFATLAEPI